MSKYFVTEDERRSMLKMHSNYNSYNNLVKECKSLSMSLDETIVITDWLSPDNKYLILLDELFDIQKGEKIGDIWENIDRFKLFIEHSFRVAENVPQQIKESVFETINGMLLTESTKDYTHMKPIILQMIHEGGLGDFLSNVGGKIVGGVKSAANWVKDQAVDFGKGVVKTVKGVGKGLYAVGKGILTGDWSAVMELLGKGLLWIARQLRSLMYNPIGIVLDGILVATGIGKTVQWIPWAIIVALDLYELVSGDYEHPEEPSWLRYLMLGTDVLGLVTTGVVAKGARTAIKASAQGAKTAEEFAQVAAKNPNTAGILAKMASAFSSVPNMLSKAAGWLKNTRIGKASSWIEGILGKSEKVLSDAASTMKKLGGGGTAAKPLTIAGQPAKQVAKTAGKEATKNLGIQFGATKGIEKGIDIYKTKFDPTYAAKKAQAAQLKQAEVAIADWEKQTGKKLANAFDT